MPPPRPGGEHPASTSARADFAGVFRNKYFWLLFVSMLLINLPNMPVLTQMSLILKELGTTGKDASVLISAYATGTLAGRFISGVALDRFPARFVAAGALGLSAVGLFVLSMHATSPILLWVAVSMVGLAYGAEADILGYLIHNIFGLRIYSMVYALISGAITIASASGGPVLSLFLP